MNTIERIILDIKTKYTSRMDARDSGRKKSFKKGSVSIVMNKSLKKGDWDESEHPRGENGQFKKGGSGGGNNGEKAEEKTKAETESGTKSETKPASKSESKPKENAVGHSEEPSEGKDKVAKSENAPQSKRFAYGTRGPQELRKYVDDGFKSGLFSDKIDWKKQNKHRKHSKEFKDAEARGEHPSWFTISDDEIEEIVKNNVHSGRVIEHLNKKTGGISYRIPFKHNKEIAKSKNDDGTKIVPVDTGEIHISRSGVHIVPKYNPSRRKKGSK